LFPCLEMRLWTTHLVILFLTKLLKNAVFNVPIVKIYEIYFTFRLISIAVREVDKYS